MRFGTIINIGAGWGYFAIGFSILYPGARIVAFETEAARRAFVKQAAGLNGAADRVEVHGLCGINELRVKLQDTPPILIFIDAEGAEASLLDPEALHALEQCHIIVELHEFLVPDIADVLKRRFERTHTHGSFVSTARRKTDFALHPSWPYSIFPERYFLDSMDEHRPGTMRWSYFCPLGGLTHEKEGLDPYVVPE